MAVEIAKKGRNFVSEVVDELKKVTWADWGQLKNATLVIIVFIIFVSLIIFAMDKVVSWLIGPSGLIMRLLGS
jgi:preprotein translocase SecE subunit